MKIDISSLVDNNPRIKEFKKQAKILLRQIKTNIKSDVTLRSCQDLVAQQHGHKHWYEFHTEIKKIYQTQQSLVKNYFYTTLPPSKEVFNYGYSEELGLNYCLGQEDRLTHTLITGEHRYKLNLHIAKQAIEANETLVFLDGTGQSNFWEIFNLARLNNREHDILTLNFMTGTQPYLGNKISNTINPFLTASSGTLTEFLVGLMDEYKDSQNMWKGRAISLLSAIMMALVYMRDQKEILLNMQVIQEYLILDNLIKLHKGRTDFPPHIRNALKSYLLSLPSFQENAIKQSETTMDQHGFLQMQFIKVLGTFTDCYGYIFSTIPEIQLSDFTGMSKKAIILVQFPCFEKSTYELKTLSYFVINMLKIQLASQMNESTKAISQTTFIIDSCPLPRGFAVLPAQARHNKVSMVLSYIDNTFDNSDNNESMSLQANCNIKIHMNSTTHYKLEYRDMKYSFNI